MLQTFPTRIKGAIGRCSALSLPWSWMDSFTFDASVVILFLDGLWSYYCSKYSFEDLDVIKCVIELCYNSSSTVCVSIPIQG